MSVLLDVLEEGRGLGFLGPGPVSDHVVHALGFAEVVGGPPEAAVDLGSGGGVPGLVLAGQWPDTRFVLLDSGQRRAAFLGDAVGRLGWADRVSVVRLRAEEFGRLPEHRGRFDLVTARSFGPPAVTAECGAPLLRVGGLLVVSEPPDGPGERWSPAAVAQLGLVFVAEQAAGARYAVLRQRQLTPDRYPRRVGIPGKRPLF